MCVCMGGGIPFFCCCFCCPAPSGCAGWAPRPCAQTSGARRCLLRGSPAEEGPARSGAASLPLRASPRLVARGAGRPGALWAALLLRDHLGWEGIGKKKNNNNNNNSNDDDDDDHDNDNDDDDDAAVFLRPFPGAAVAFRRPPAEGSALCFPPPPAAAAASAAATSAGLEETGRLSRRTDVKVTSACDKGAGIRLGGEAFLRLKKKREREREGKY